MERTNDALQSFYADFFAAWDRQEALADDARRAARREGAHAAADACAAERLRARQAARSAQLSAHKAIRRMSVLVGQHRQTSMIDERRGTARKEAQKAQQDATVAHFLGSLSQRRTGRV